MIVEFVVMINILVSSVIVSSIDRVWSVVRDFGGMPNWHPLIDRCRIEAGMSSDQVGCVRNFYLTDGSHVRERLLSLSDLDYEFSYNILDSDLSVRDYVAGMRLRRVTDVDHTFGEWWARFSCSPELEDEMRETISRGVFQAGFDSLNARFK